MDNELYHYGVKGMRWGVRKKDISNLRKYRARKKAKKQALKEEREANKDALKRERSRQNEVNNRSNDLASKYDFTQEGKKKRSEYDKKVKKLDSNYDLANDENFLKDFNKKEADYLQSRGRYIAKNLLNEGFSNEDLQSAMAGWNYSSKPREFNKISTEKLIKRYGEVEYSAHHL